MENNGIIFTTRLIIYLIHKLNKIFKLSFLEEKQNRMKFNLQWSDLACHTRHFY